MEAAAILHGLWVFLPAYLANMSPVFIAKLIPRWNHPIDGGRVGKDGNRILGKNKTWRGLFGGALTGGLTAIGLVYWSQHWDVMAGWDFGHGGHFDGFAVGVRVVDGSTSQHTPLWAVGLFGALLGFMALVGDATKSYFKRRRGKQSGDSWIPFDQLDFVVFGLLSFLIGAPLLADGWVKAALLDDPLVLITIIGGTIGLHLLVNRIGYWLKLKDVPW